MKFMFMMFVWRYQYKQSIYKPELALTKCAKELHPTLEPPLDLVMLWDSLVGAGAENIQSTKIKITDVSIEAMRQIIQYYPEFTYGVVLDNLPEGFYIQETVIDETGEDKNVLRYDADGHKNLDTITPLTINLAKPFYNSAYGTYNQFRCVPSASLCDNQYIHL